jgi:hypothetical protein
VALPARFRYPPPMPSRTDDPLAPALFGAIAGASIASAPFVICEGLELRDTYAHVMAPYLAAFRRPERPGLHHPAPWKPAGGGLVFDALIEIAMTADCAPVPPLDRLNTLWWVTALLRLRTGRGLRLPVISDVSFASIPTHPREPRFWSIEVSPHGASNDNAALKGELPDANALMAEWSESARQRAN